MKRPFWRSIAAYRRCFRRLCRVAASTSRPARPTPRSRSVASAPPRPPARRLAAAALQPLQPRRLRPGSGRFTLRVGPIDPTAHHGEVRPADPVRRHPAAARDVAESVLNFFHDNVGLSWGTSIIALTVCVRAILIPLTYSQIKGMRALQALQPQIKEIQEKFKNDRQRQQQEMMRFYQENKVNPLSSCLPLLAAAAGLLRALPDSCAATNSRKTSSLSAAEPVAFIKLGDRKAARRPRLIVLVILFGVSMALSTQVMMRSSPTAAGAQQYVMLGVFALVGALLRADRSRRPEPLLDHDQLLDRRPAVAAKLIPAPACPLRRSRRRPNHRLNRQEEERRRQGRY